MAIVMVSFGSKSEPWLNLAGRNKNDSTLHVCFTVSQNMLCSGTLGQGTVLD